MSNSAVTGHHLALLYIGLYSLSIDMLSTCLLPDVFQIEGCLADLDVHVCAVPYGLPVSISVQLDTGGWVDTKREVRLCQVCHSSKDVEDEQHFLSSYPAYSDVRQKHASLFQQAFSVSDFLTDSEPNACNGLLRESFSRRKPIVST